LIPVFREWKRTTDEYIKSKRDSFEWIFLSYPQFSYISSID
jgi:hypothetical protein